MREFKILGQREFGSGCDWARLTCADSSGQVVPNVMSRPFASNGYVEVGKAAPGEGADYARYSTGDIDGRARPVAYYKRDAGEWARVEADGIPAAVMAALQD